MEITHMQSAAMYVTAVECVENASDSDTKLYMMGVRDVLESLFRAVYEVPDDYCAQTYARQILAVLSPVERVHLLTSAQQVIYSRRSESFSPA